MIALELHIRKLAKHGVRLVSITQQLDDDDPAQVVMRQMIGMFDESQSRENGKHVLRAMKAVVCWPNERGYRTLANARFSAATAGGILTNVGELYFNKRSSKTLQQKAENEWIPIEAPPILSREEFDALQTTLQSRDPQVTPARRRTARSKKA